MLPTRAAEKDGGMLSRLTISLLRSSARPHRYFSLSAVRNMKVVPVPVRSDNYAYLLIDEKTKKAAAVDVYDVPKVQAAAKNEGVDIIAALTTHHHHDHSGGNAVCPSPLLHIPCLILTSSGVRKCSHHRRSSIQALQQPNVRSVYRLRSTQMFRSMVGAPGRPM